MAPFLVPLPLPFLSSTDFLVAIVVAISLALCEYKVLPFEIAWASKHVAQLPSAVGPITKAGRETDV